MNRAFSIGMLASTLILSPALGTAAVDEWACLQQADTDGDGRVEFLRSGAGPEQAWTLCCGDRELNLPVPSSLVHKACLADVDGDGKAEILIAHTAATPNNPGFQQRLFIYRRHRDNLQPVFLGSQGWGPLLDFTTKDLDGDGKLEVITWESRARTRQVRVWRWEGYGLIEAKNIGASLPPPGQGAPILGSPPSVPDAQTQQTPAPSPEKLSFARSPGRMRQARIRPDLAPAANAKAFRFLPKAARRHLAKHGFVVLEPPEAPAEVHNVYIENQYKRLPGFVTADAALHLTHLVFDLVLQDMEMRLLAPGLARWSADGANLARSLVTSLPPGLQDGMRRLAQRLAIGACLLGVEVQCEDAAVAHAARDIEELRCPESARCLDPDGYRVRGHYQNNESLQRYFRARLWLGENLTDWAEVAAAALLLSHWSDGRRTLARREELERSLVGPAANKTSTALLALARMNLGPSPDWSAWANARNWPDAAHLREQPISLLARRWTADNHVLSSGFDESRRPEPSPLDLLQALGSEEARRRLRDQEQAWPELSERLDAQRRSFRQGDLLDLFSVGGRWLAALRWLLLPYPKGYARFQQDPAWAGHGMVGAAASWAELRRDTLLYVQPPIHYMEGGDEDQLPAHQAGFVEAVPELYRELALVCDQSRKAYAGLGGQQLDQPTRRTSEAGPMTKLRRLEDLLDFLAACADKHLAGKALVRDEHQRLHGIGTEFEHIAAGKGHLKAKPVPVVADVFVVVDPEDGSRKRLMLATGPLRWIVVALPLGKRTILARGAVASFYSFWRAEPIDDQQWQDELDNAPSPKPVNWRASFPLPKRKARQ